MHSQRLALLVPLLLLTACGSEEPPAPEARNDSAPAARTAPGSPATTEDAGEEATAEEGAATAAGQEGEEEGTGLRARVQKTPPPEEKEDPYFSTAMTLEERKANVRKALERAGEDGIIRLDMHDLGGWEFDETKEQPFPEYVRELEGRTMEMRGFMMPAVDFENIREFHLVRSLWGCCFGAPPRINELIRVELSEDEDAMDYTYNSLKVRGTFHAVFEMEDGLIEDVYRLTGATYEIMDYDDPLAPAGADPETAYDGIIPGLEEF